ncbi:MAG: PqqD family peptide modification chaperone [Candidatus Binatia bacterium]
MESKLSRTSVVVAAKDQVWCDLVGEAVILNLKSGVYFGLDPVGGRVWSLIQEPKTVGAVVEALLQEYDVESSRCEADVLALLEELANRALLEVKVTPDGSAG